VLQKLGYQLTRRDSEFYLDLSAPIDVIWNRLKDTRRQKIRKATRLCVDIRREESDNALALLYQFVGQSLERRNVAWRTGPDMVQRAKDYLLARQRSVLAVGYHDGQPINAALFGVFGGRAYYVNSGSSLEGYKYSGPVQLLWIMVEHFKAEGVATLNLGGAPKDGQAGANGQGLFSFKEDFGGEVVQQAAGFKVLSGLGKHLITASQLWNLWSARFRHPVRTMRNAIRRFRGNGVCDGPCK